MFAGARPISGCAAVRTGPPRSRWPLALAGCGGGTQLISGSGPELGVVSKTPHASQRLGFPTVATKNTTRVGGSDPVADAAAVALAVYPSQAQNTHPPAVVLAPTRRLAGLDRRRRR